jgi:ABC-type branched-subunit amino acid transport system ATPase component/ABC-type branched-subunit amino acid transport system permease subunit
MALFYSHSHFGRATAALVENRRALSACGVSPDFIAGVNWAVGGLVAAAAGILLAPIAGLSVTQFTELVLPGLAAAVIGRFQSFSWVLAGGLLIGVVQSEMTRYVTAPGWSGAAPFLVVIVFLVLRGHRERGLRTRLNERFPNVGSGTIKLRLVVPAVLIGGVLVTVVGASWSEAITVTIGSAIVLLSFVVVTGYTAQLSLAQWSIAGVGALVTARLVALDHMSFIPALLLGVAATIPIGLAVGFVCLRTRGVYLAVVTMGLAVALEQVVFNNPSWVGGLDGLNPGVPSIFGLKFGPIGQAGRYAIFALLCFAIAGVIVANLRRGRIGRRLLAARANERAALSLGINVAAGRVYAFTVGSALAALGGIVVAFQSPIILFTGFTALSSIQYVTGAIVGGVGWIMGPVLGGTLQPGSIGGRVFQLIPVSNFQQYLTLFGGLLLIAILIQSPDGLAYLNWRNHGKFREKWGHPRKLSLPPELPSSVSIHRVAPRELTVEALRVYFGGVHALDGVDLSIRPGQVIGVIGPNGAGKTTLIDAITGYVKTTSGTIRLDGEVITRLAPNKLARKGVVRSFQSLELFDDLSVLDNLRAAAEPRDNLSWLTDLVHPVTPPLTPTTLAAIEEFDLRDDLLKTPPELPYGKRRVVAIARAVATGASILLLDEPAAGLDTRERRELSGLIRKLAKEWGMGVLLIEHDVALILEVCDYVHALDFGNEIASGEPDEVRNNDAVIEAYLGVDTPTGDQGGSVLDRGELIIGEPATDG